MNNKPNYSIEFPCQIELSRHEFAIQHGTARVSEGTLEGVFYIGASRMTDNGEFVDVHVAFRASNKRSYRYRTTIYAATVLPFDTPVELVTDDELTAARNSLRDDGYSLSCTLDDRSHHSIRTMCGQTIQFFGKYVSCTIFVRPSPSGSVFKTVSSLLIEHDLVTSPYGLLMRYDYSLNQMLWHRGSHAIGRDPLIQDLDYVDITEDTESTLASLPCSPIEIMPS